MGDNGSQPASSCAGGHPESETSCWAVAVNNSNECVDAALTVAPGWQLEKDEHAKLAPFTGKLLKLIKK